MNVLYLSISSYDSIETRAVSTDLLREFVKNGHHVYIVCSTKSCNLEGISTEGPGVTFVRTCTSVAQQTNFIKKGINTLLVPRRYKRVVKKFLNNVKFDLVLNPTPPITFAPVIEYVKKRDGALSYLILKDIFPQNAVDIGLMSQSGLKGVVYKYFRHLEKKLYRTVDYIGCMSQANVDYLINHNSYLNPDKINICPNGIDYVENSLLPEEIMSIRKQYGLPLDKKIFVYGGNLGKPQCVPFIIEAISALAQNDKIFFVVVGSGTDYHLIKDYVDMDLPTNLALFPHIPTDQYNELIAACDVGLIFLDWRFTIPNFPSRMLAYMQAELPILACTDNATDAGRVIVENGLGWSCPSNDVNQFVEVCQSILEADISKMKPRIVKFLKEHYLATNSYDAITIRIEKTVTDA